MVLKWLVLSVQIFAFINAEEAPVEEVPVEEFEYDWNNTESKYEYNDIIGSQQIGRAEAVFSYDETDDYGPSKWFKTWPTCGGTSQTPINIEDSDTKKVAQPAVTMNYFKKQVNSIRFVNNEHTVAFVPTFVDSKPNLMRCCGNGIAYVLDSIHIHWGPDCGGGSEHTINGHRYAAEMHLVHFNQKYKTLANAVTYKDGLGVVGVFFQITEEPASYDGRDNKWVQYLKQIIDPGEFTAFNPFSIQDLIKFEVKNYYAYKGSLTVPPCSENVQWAVSTKPIKIYPSELEKLRSLIGHDGEMLANFRPLQPRFSRVVTCC